MLYDLHKSILYDLFNVEATLKCMPIPLLGMHANFFVETLSLQAKKLSWDVCPFTFPQTLLKSVPSSLPHELPLIKFEM
jgi:hypothetical protein